MAEQVFGQLNGVDQFDFKEVSSSSSPCKVLMAALGLPMGDEHWYPKTKCAKTPC
jgi:hypothetical protein